MDTMLSDTISRFNHEYLSTIEKSDNIFYSPYGIATVLSIAANGADGETKKELLHALGCEAVPNEEYGEFQKRFGKLYAKSVFLISSNLLLLGEKSVADAINPDFIKTVTNFYQSEIREADFAHDLAGERERIRAWVDEKTQHIIPDYQSVVTDDAVLNFLNVICFKGEWAHEFDEGLKDGVLSSRKLRHIFGNKDGSESNVKFMSKEFWCSIPYYEDEKYKGIALPYRKDWDKNQTATAMLVIMPKDENDRNIAEEWVSETVDYQREFMQSIKDSSDEIIVDVHLPKFELTTNHDVKKSLAKMGVNLAFSDFAEFSSMVDYGKIKDGVKIGSISHQAKIEVDENGTEAAAVTEMIPLFWGFFPIPTPRPRCHVEFHAYRPFLFIIQDLASGIDLFTGVVNKLYAHERKTIPLTNAISKT